jgi:hypothetical protein
MSGDFLLFVSDSPLAQVRDEPDRWHAVYDLRPLEFWAALVGLYRPLRPALAMKFHSASGRYLSYPLEQMPARFRNRTLGPTATCWVALFPTFSRWFGLLRAALTRRPLFSLRIGEVKTSTGKARSALRRRIT